MIAAALTGITNSYASKWRGHDGGDVFDELCPVCHGHFSGRGQEGCALKNGVSVEHFVLVVVIDLGRSGCGEGQSL